MMIKLLFPPGLGVEWVGDSDTRFAGLVATDHVPDKKDTFDTWIYV